SVEDGDLVPIDDPRPLHLIDVDRADGLDLEPVTGMHLFELAEEPVAVSSDADVAVLARSRRVFDVADALVQGPVVGAFAHRHFERDARNAEDRQRRGGVAADRDLPRALALGRPEPLIRRLANG